MKTLNKAKIFHILFSSFVLTVPAIALPQEAVNGYYDTKNDWIVFEWNDLQATKQQRIYDSANKIKPILRASTSFDNPSTTFTYKYQVTNDTSAPQTLADIYIGHTSQVSQVTVPNPQDEWYSAEAKGTNLWHWALIRHGAKGISAGQTVTGLTFKSKGLPAIVAASFSGKRRAHYGFPNPDEDSEDVQSSFDRVFKNLQTKYPSKFVDSVQQKTIGPVDPPAVFNASSSIQNLIDLVNQSRTQNWIDNDGMANLLLAKLSSAALKATNDPKTTKSVLGAFLSDVQAQNGKHLTSEAYALLYFNGKYVVDRL